MQQGSWWEKETAGRGEKKMGDGEAMTHASPLRGESGLKETKRSPQTNGRGLWNMGFCETKRMLFESMTGMPTTKYVIRN